jgi:hypothetical protein
MQLFCLLASFSFRGAAAHAGAARLRAAHRPLSAARLEGVRSIECLHELERDRNANCATAAISPATREIAPTIRNEQWSVATDGFPRPDAVPGVKNGDHDCASGGTYFCDPDRVIPADLRVRVQEDLRAVRDFTLVECPISGLRARAHTPNVARPDEELSFTLGVAVAKGLPDTSDEYLQEFGRSVLESWKLLNSDCDRAALIIIAPDVEKVWLTTQTCRFVCSQDTSGERVLAALRSAGTDWGQGLRAAVRTLLAVLKENDGVHYTPKLGKVDRVEKYRERREQEWAEIDTRLEILVAVIAVASVIGICTWYQPWLSNLPAIVGGAIYAAVIKILTIFYTPVFHGFMLIRDCLFCCAMCCCLETYNKSMIAFGGAKEVSERVGRGVVKFAEPVPRPAQGWFGETAGFRKHNGPIG